MIKSMTDPRGSLLTTVYLAENARRVVKLRANLNIQLFHRMIHHQRFGPRHVVQYPQPLISDAFDRLEIG